MPTAYDSPAFLAAGVNIARHLDVGNCEKLEYAFPPYTRSFVDGTGMMAIEGSFSIVNSIREIRGVPGRKTLARLEWVMTRIGLCVACLDGRSEIGLRIVETLYASGFVKLQKAYRKFCPAPIKQQVHNLIHFVNEKYVEVASSNTSYVKIIQSRDGKAMAADLAVAIRASLRSGTQLVVLTDSRWVHGARRVHPTRY